jgi:hypothetical protein
MSKALARHEAEPGMGPAMLALPSPKWRTFVTAFVFESIRNAAKDNYGAQAAAARRAGFGKPSTSPRSMAHIAWRLLQDPRIQTAVAEESRKYFRSLAPEAIKAVETGIRNPKHKDHARFVSMVLDRADPVLTQHNIEVAHVHEHRVEATPEALERIRELARAIGLEPGSLPPTIDAECEDVTGEPPA